MIAANSGQMHTKKFIGVGLCIGVNRKDEHLVSLQPLRFMNYPFYFISSTSFHIGCFCKFLLYIIAIMSMAIMSARTIKRDVLDLNPRRIKLRTL